MAQMPGIDSKKMEGKMKRKRKRTRKSFSIVDDTIAPIILHLIHPSSYVRLCHFLELRIPHKMM